MIGTPKGPVPPIPLTVVTGFLGAGKTTLVNRLLKDQALADTVVIVNEFGEIGLDHLLIEAIGDGAVLLQSGCLCCTIRGDLVNTLEGLLRKRDNGRIAPFRRVLVETTGLADPAPVLQTVMAHPYLSLRYALEGVVTLVDAVNGMATLDAHAEAVKQAAVADRLVLSKLDLAAPAQCAALKARLAGLNPSAPALDARTVRAAELLDAGLFDPEGKTPDVAGWLRDEELLAATAAGSHRHPDGTIHLDGRGEDASAAASGQPVHDVNRHDDAIRAHAFATDRAISSTSLALFVDLLRSAHGPRLLRLKAVVKIAEHPDTPVILHGVQHVFHPPVMLKGWRDGDRRTRMVVITRNLEPSFVQGLWEAFLAA